MNGKPRVKRMDRIGNTTEIPEGRTLSDVKKQRWIIDRFYRLMGRSAIFWDNPDEGLGTGVIRGSNYFDLLDTASRIKCMDELPKENIRTAKRLEGLGKREEEAGHRETACGFYYRACIFYLNACWGIFDSEDPELIWLTEKIRTTFDKVIRYSNIQMERVEIPFEGKSLSAILSLAPGGKKAPTVLFIPGMDVHKENGLNHLHNFFVLRGMNTLALDGPGQGESLIRKIWVDAENYGRAGKAAIDYLSQRPEVDVDKIAVHGFSMGTYWGPLIAIQDPRVKALATNASCYYNKDHIFNETSPNFRLRFMWMAGNVNDEEFDYLVARMTLQGKESQIKCPHIIFHGQFDHLTSTDEVYRYFNHLGSEIKEFRIYENQYHSTARHFDDVMNLSADWLRDRLFGVPPKEKRRIVLIDWNREEHPVDEEKLASGFSDIIAE